VQLQQKQFNTIVVQ